jgi:hypothetical protein
MLLAVVVITLPIAIWMVLLARLWTFRKDRGGLAEGTSSLYDGTYRAREILSPSLYTEDGRRLLPWVWAGGVLVVAGFVVGMFLFSITM